MKIVFIGYGDVIKNQIVSAQSAGYDVDGWFVPEKIVSSGHAITLSMKIPLYKYSDLKKSEVIPDLFIINECDWFIPTECFKGMKAINFHAGLLPVWRGFSANLWAIMKNEAQIGYSVNLATEKLDGGGIIYQFKVINDFNSFYADMRKSIIDDMIHNLDEIIKRATLGLEQKNEDLLACYCPKMNNQMGIINNWNLNAVYIYNLYRIFGHESSSGFFLQKDNRLLKVKNAILSDFNSVGVAGAVVYNDQNYIYVNTKLGVLGFDIGERLNNGTLLDGWQLINN